MGWFIGLEEVLEVFLKCLEPEQCFVFSASSQFFLIFVQDLKRLTAIMEREFSLEFATIFTPPITTFWCQHHFRNHPHIGEAALEVGGGGSFALVSFSPAFHQWLN